MINENKLAQFNWKLMHNILPNMAQLKVWSITDCDKCVVCNTVEDAEHLFIGCVRLGTFWKQVEVLLFKLFHERVQCLWRTVLLGIDTKNEELNQVITLAAFTVFKSWVSGEKDKAILLKCNVWQTFLNEVKNRAHILQELKQTGNVYQKIVDLY